MEVQNYEKYEKQVSNFRIGGDVYNQATLTQYLTQKAHRPIFITTNIRRHISYKGVDWI
jgi:hypothetical protein